MCFHTPPPASTVGGDKARASRAMLHAVLILKTNRSCLPNERPGCAQCRAGQVHLSRDEQLRVGGPSFTQTATRILRTHSKPQLGNIIIHTPVGAETTREQCHNPSLPTQTRGCFTRSGQSALAQLSETSMQRSNASSAQEYSGRHLRMCAERRLAIFLVYEHR